nr:type VI secretion system Vgr family protein [uncultured Pseudomonas sp.]
MALTDQPLCTFQSDALAHESLLVASWQGEDVLSRPYRFEAVLATGNPLFDEDAMLGQPACLTLFDAQGAAHPYHGIVTQVEQLDSDDLYHYSRVVLEPRMTRLRLQRFSEIWLDKNLPELLRDVLKHADLVAEGPGAAGMQDDSADYDFDLRLRDEDVARTQANFTCQYEETSFDFLSRLLEYYGCYYFFEQRTGHEALVICNERSFQPQTPLPVLYRPLDSALEVESAAIARSFTRSASLQPAQVILQDFSASNAQLALHAAASVAASSVAPEAEAPAASAAFSGHYGVYGEHFGSNEEGSWLAGLRAQAIGSRHRLFNGNGRATGLRSGSQLALLGHPRLPLNGSYQVLEARHNGSQPLPGNSDDSVQNEALTRFVVIPADVQFRPALDTPKPNARGVITAIVDGDDNGKALLNEHGCYKVSFPFIRSEKKATRGSAWLRMATMSAGTDHGMHFPLLKGSEVLVAFLGGDPDRPIITGSVPNSENPSRVTEHNASQSGLSTTGGHYLAIEDNPNGAHMKMGAPAGNTLFTLGDGDVKGANLRTDAHMQLASASYKHVVPGLYSHEITSEASPSTGGDSTEQPSEPSEPSETSEPSEDTEDLDERVTALEPTKEIYNEQWGPAWMKKAGMGAKIGYSNSRTFSVEFKTSATQTEASFGLFKLELGVQALAVDIKLAGPSREFSFGKGTVQFHNFKNETAAAKQRDALIDTLEAGVSKLEAELHAITAKLYNLTVTQGVTITSGEHSITMNALGVSIKSPTAIILDGPVTIKGAVKVTGDITTTGKISCVSAEMSDSVTAATTSAGNLNATRATFGEPYIPPLPPIAVAEALAAAEAFTALQETVAGLQQVLLDATEATVRPMSEAARAMYA